MGGRGQQLPGEVSRENYSISASHMTFLPIPGLVGSQVSKRAPRVLEQWCSFLHVHAQSCGFFVTLKTVASRLLFCLWDSPGKNTGVGGHFLLQGILRIQGLNPCLLHFLHWHVGSLPQSQLGSPCCFPWHHPNLAFCGQGPPLTPSPGDDTLMAPPGKISKQKSRGGARMATLLSEAGPFVKHLLSNTTIIL